jgi:hypothetical protein
MGVATPLGSEPSPARPPFVARGAELEQLERLFEAAEGGEPQLAVIHGAPGIGKTRLAEEVAERSRRRGGRVAVGRCWQDGEAPPFWPWRGVLRDLGAPENLLEERPGQAQGRFARFVAVLDHLRRAATATPFAIVIDDAHLADPASLLLGRFLTRERGLRLLLLLTCRDPTPDAAGEVVELLEEMGREAVAIPLGGLSEEAVGAYLSAFGVSRPDPQLLHAVAAVTKGNPLHLRSITTQSDLGAGGVGGGLELAVRRQFDRLRDADRRLISLAALLGPDVSAHEVARLAEAPPALAVESLTRSTELGLATPLDGDRFRFVHELVRRVATSALAVADRLDAHARAATLLTGHEPDQISRRAHHALAAASRSREDADRSVAIAREAARALKAADGFESAAALLGRAAEIHAAAGLAAPAAEMVVEHGDAVLACGRLAESRPLFQHGARLAEKEGNTVAFARAALGLGGVWVSEHRLAGDAERMFALQRRALEALPGEHAVLRARLGVRLAAEEAHRGGDLEAVLPAVEAVRKEGDAHAHAEALSLAHHAHASPEHTWRRLAMANEMISAAAAAGDGFLSLVGLCWRAADLFLVGDPAAVRALEELKIRADAVNCRSVLFIVRCLEVMLAIRAGEFEKAEAAAAACFALGTEVGDADALAFHGAHLSAIRLFQGREAELADMAATIASSPTLTGQERAFSSGATLFAARAGRPQAGLALLERLSRDGLGSIPPSSSWLVSLLGVVELAYTFHDEGCAQAAYDALLPYADLPVMGSLLAIVCFGSVHRPLALAALTCGKVDLAVEHFAAALAANEQLGHRPAAIQAQAELGLARLRRSKGDDPRGRTLLRDALAAGEAAGMSGLVARWRAAAEETPATSAVGDAAAVLITPVQAGTWRVVYERQVAVVPDRVGMRYLSQLVTAPDRGIPALALVVQGAAGGVEQGPDAVMDRKALAAVRDRIRDLRARPSLSPGDEDELAALTRELARASGLGGRIRSFVDAPERARTAVRKAIKRSIDEIAAVNPAVGRHLAERVETGSVCRYRLEPAPPAHLPDLRRES